MNLKETFVSPQQVWFSEKNEWFNLIICKSLILKEQLAPDLKKSEKSDMLILL